MMKLLIAPAHYLINRTSGSEVTRAYEYIRAISKDKEFHGDIIVGYSDLDRIGNFKIHCLFKTEPIYISTYIRLKFILLVFLKSFRLLLKNKYDCIWHLGPFAIDQTFSLIGLLNRKKIRYVIGPIYTPHIEMKESDHGSFEISAEGKVSNLSFKNRVDSYIYKRFNRSLSRLSTYTLKVANKVITIDRVGEKMLTERNIKNTKVITLGIAADHFLVAPREKKDEKYTLLTVSYLFERKRVIDLIEAVKILKEKYKFDDFKLVIVGDGPQKNHLEKVVKEYNLVKFVEFKGLIPRTKVHNFYKSADIFLSGSISDIMPGMYFEAMAASLPMILAENITSIELKRKKFGGLVVKGERPNLIAEALVEVMNNKEMYNAFSTRNYHLMQTDYNFDNAISNLKDTFISK